MRFSAIFFVVLLASLLSGPSEASVHLMQIEQVIGGVDGDVSAQAVQLRMRSSFQNQLQLSKLLVWDAEGLSPVVVMEFPSAVAEHGAGVRVLITSPGFDSATIPPTVSDFTMTNLIPESYLAAGSLTFENSTGTTIYWRLSWGGSNYTGPTDGAITNDADGEFGPAWPDPAPFSGVEALLFQGTAADPSSNNTDDYALTEGAATFTNNAGESFLLDGSTSSVDVVEASVDLHVRSFPNPFTLGTHFQFDLAVASRAELRIHDIAGREVAVLAEVFAAGSRSLAWDGRDESGSRVPTGIYSYRLKVGERETNGQVVLVR